MNRTWATEDVANNGGRTVAEQLQNIGHRDHVANSPEINAWHRVAPARSQPAEQRRGTRTFAQACREQPANQRLASNGDAQQLARATEKRNP
jgi:hypothetical protein